MNIYFMRHAEPNSGQSDKDRTLTKNGESSIFKAATGWLPLIPNLSYIIASPYKRTYQTAEIVKIIFQSPNEIILDNNMQPGCRSSYIEEMAECFKNEDILFVGHDPDLSYHISYFTGEMDVKRFKYGSLAKISFDDNLIREGLGKLVFLLDI